MEKYFKHPKAIGSPPGAFKIALNHIKQMKHKDVLDCPSGEGIFSKMLQSMNVQVSACDIDTEQFNVQGITCDYGDLNTQLPYNDHTFDAVACLNGLQRIWARGRAVSELARVTKPGGSVIISFPNNSDLRRRLLFLMTGSVTWNVIGPPQVCNPDSKNPASCYRYPMTVANVVSAVKSVGLRYEKLLPTHYTKGSIVLSPLIPVIVLFKILCPKKYKKFYYLDKATKMNSLMGGFLVIISKKI